MPRRSLSEDLKRAVSALSNKEKDRLLYRLIPKDDILTEQLTFKLLEFAATTEERRQEVARFVDDTLTDYSYKRFSPVRLARILRSISGRINRHVRVTRDKYGEIELNIQMLRVALETFGEILQDFSVFQRYKLCAYMAQRYHKIHTLLDKLHEDYRLDFQDQLRLLVDAMLGLPDLKQAANL